MYKAATIQKSFWKFLNLKSIFVVSLIIWIIANSDKDIFNDEKHAMKMVESFAMTNNYPNLLNQITESDE